jgi:hypothetical protein
MEKIKRTADFTHFICVHPRSSAVFSLKRASTRLPTSCPSNHNRIQKNARQTSGGHLKTSR